MRKKKKVVICGAGLAGTFLATRLCEHGHEVVLTDPGDENNASSVAAGLYNLVTGKFSVLTWMAEELLESLENFFDAPQFASLAVFLHKKPFYRPFPGIADLNDWSVKAGDPPYNRLISITTKPHDSGLFDDKFGGYWVHPTGWLEVKPFLKALKDLLVTQYGINLKKERVDAKSVNLHQKTIMIGNELHKYDALVFAEGVAVNHNPFFNWMPVLPLKGQLLEGDIEGLDIDFLFSGGVFLVPLEKGKFIAGSTYEREFSHSDPDEAGKADILSRMPEPLRMKFKITNHLAGIRPATRDRKPILGSHPEIPDIYIFNGLGAKGVLQAPYFSEMLAQFISGETGSIPREVSPARFVKQFFVTWKNV